MKEKSEERKRQVGDLVTRYDGGQNLCVGFTGKECIWLTQEGKLFYSNLYNDYTFRCNTGLAYKFTSDEQAQRDFRSGLFEKHFQPDVVTESGTETR